jgi:hypothetical protein
VLPRHCSFPSPGEDFVNLIPDDQIRLSFLFPCLTFSLGKFPGFAFP